MSTESGTRQYEHDSGLGQWSVAVLPVHPALRGVVAQIWLGDGRVAYRRDRILPQALSYLLINLGPAQYRVLPGEPTQFERFDDIWFSGLSEAPIDCEAPDGSVLLGVAFHASGAAHLLPWPQVELANRTGPLLDLIGGTASGLRERLLNTVGANARLRLVEAWLLDVCTSGRSIHPLVHWATRRLADCGGRLRSATLAREAGISRKHLAGLFQTQVGLAPKALARVHRFGRALDRISASSAPDYCALALDCGYYDQSHLINEFRQYAGVTPSEFLRMAKPDPRSVVVR